MYIIQIEANEIGSRPPLQEWHNATAPEGFALCPDEFFDVFYSTSPAGFVNITVEGDTVTEMTVNQEALDAYIASLPEPSDPEPVEPVENVNYDDLAAAITEGVNEI
jgi:hypothetical protein